MARKHYTESAAGHHELRPREDDPLSERWNEMNRFEKVCWLWADANSRIRRHVVQYVKFENLLRDYDYFAKNIETYLGIEVGEKLWRDTVSMPANTTKRFNLPKWTKWDDNQMEAFNSICAAEMAHFGYY